MKCKTMARLLRIEFEGAFYRYTTSRGNQRVAIIQMRDCSNKKTIYREELTVHSERQKKVVISEGAERLRNPKIPRGVYTEQSECARNDKH